MTAWNIHSGSKRADRPDGGMYVNKTDIARTLDASGGLEPSKNDGGVAITQEIPVNEPLGFDGYNQTLNKTMQTIRADKSDGDHVGMIMNETVVRRLTPIECERLQGFPDDWAAQRIDHKTGNVIEQKDSARYKQMGNAVAVPCVQWLLARIVERMDDV